MKKILIALMICLFPAFSLAGTRTLQVDWSYDPPVPTDLAGFVLYADGAKVASITDPVARRFTGEMTVKDGPACYTLTAIDTGGIESPPSPCYNFDLPPGTPGNVVVRIVVDVNVTVPTP